MLNIELATKHAIITHTTLHVAVSEFLFIFIAVACIIVYAHTYMYICVYIGDNEDLCTLRYSAKKSTNKMEGYIDLNIWDT